MQTTSRRFISGLCGAAGIAVGLVFTGHASAGEADQRICDDDSSYVKQRLASDQKDDLCKVYEGKVLLVVNTASRCAFTDQYDGLEQLYKDYARHGLVVIGFPSNDFGHQEPGSEQSIKEFCRLTYGVQFPMYAKTRVTGNGADPFYSALAEAAGHGPRWNFHKYLIDREGRFAGSFGSSVEPQSETLTRAIEQLL